MVCCYRSGGVLHYTREAAHISLYTQSRVVDFVKNGQEILGIVCNHEKNGQLPNAGKIFTIWGLKVVLAGKGFDGLYRYHTNFKSLNGDLHGICVQCGIGLINMHLTQFHPTVLKHKGASNRSFTKRRRALDETDTRFLFDYDKRGKLATRDIVSHSIYMPNVRAQCVFRF